MKIGSIRIGGSNRGTLHKPVPNNMKISNVSVPDSGKRALGATINQGSSDNGQGQSGKLNKR